MDVNTYAAYYEETTGWWIPSSDINALFHVDLDGKSEFIGKFEGYSKKNGWIISKIVATDNALYFFSRTEFVLWKYSRVERKLECVPYSKRRTNMIVSAEKVDNQIWVFPHTFDVPILVLSLENMSAKEVQWNCDLSYGESSITRPVVVDDMIYFATRKKGNIVMGCIDTLKEIVEYVALDCITYINGTDVNGNAIWALGRDEDDRIFLVRMDISTHRVDYLDVTKQRELWPAVQTRYFKILVRENVVYCFGPLDYVVKVLNLSSGELTEIKEPVGPYAGGHPLEVVRNDIQIVGQKVYIFSPVLGRIQVLDMEKRSMSSLPITFGSSLLPAMRDNLKNGGLVEENHTLTVRRFLEAVLDEGIL